MSKKKQSLSEKIQKTINTRKGQLVRAQDDVQDLRDTIAELKMDLKQAKAEEKALQTAPSYS